MMKTASLLVLLLASAARAAEVQRIPVTVADRPLVLVPEIGQLLTPAGERLRGSAIWSDSKAQAFHLGPSEVVKFYTGPRYQVGEWQRPLEQVTQWGKNETALMRQWAALGLARPVVAEATTPEGIHWAVLEKPRGASGSYLIKKGRFAEISDKLKRLAQGLTESGWELGTFNPTQVYVDRRGGKALLIKAYTDDRQEPAKPESELARHYDQRLAVFEALNRLYPAYKAGETLHDGRPALDKAQIWSLTLEAIRTQRPLRIVYQASPTDRVKVFHALPLENSLRKNDFMKGYIRTLLFPENGRTGKEYTFRLDRVQEAQLLAE